MYYYDEQERENKYESYWANGEMYAYWINEYDENGVLARQVAYNPDGAMTGYELNE